MLIHFYDIESLTNVFSLANLIPEKNLINIYYLCDNPEMIDHPDLKQLLLDRIKKENKNWNGTIECYNLQFEEPNRHLAKEFGLSDAYNTNNPDNMNTFGNEFRLVCDTDPEYNNEIHAYLAGYNSYNYDTTELAEYFVNTWQQTQLGRQRYFQPTTAKVMRDFNNQLFTPRFKPQMPSRLAVEYNYATHTYSQPDYKRTAWKVRKNMLLSGRHLDIARLNEKQQKVAEKRLLGMMGFQILESNKLRQGQDTIETLDQFLDLIAYNVSDIVNLRELFNLQFYQGQFTLKKGLLDTYPELIYEKLPDKYAADIRPQSVRKDRLLIDSSSAQLATKALCPYDHLTDTPVVSYMYPSEEKSKELGIPRVNVLEESKKFFYANFEQPEIREEFDRIYNYYKQIEGRNFNESQSYALDFTTNPDDTEYHAPENIALEPKVNMNIFYYNQDGSPSNCYVNFSTGGIHGAEYNKQLYNADTIKWEQQMRELNYAKQCYADPIDCRKAKTIVMPDGKIIEYKTVLKNGATMKKAEYRDIESLKPAIFKQDSKGKWELNTAYAYTSSAHGNHEDFTSYYPNMLRMLSAFFNAGLGYDRYAEIFDNKQNFGKLMKDKTLEATERNKYAILREGTKLVLNAASGAADATFESNIRMNNRIISMRIIGQLFTWRIGQVQTIHGAQIISTNTDGLYSVLEESINNPILAKESADIGVEIEPEPLYLISKDSNNRIEMENDLGNVISASGGTLACRQGPNPTKALAHSAIIDWAMTEYLIIASTNYKNTALNKPFVDEIGASILQQSIFRISQEKDKNTNQPKGKREVLRMFQNVLASSPASQTYIFATTNDEPDKPIIMQHYNRIFIVKDDTPNSVFIQAARVKKITPSEKKKRQRENERPQQHNPLANYVLAECGEDISNISIENETSIKKVTGIEDNWKVLIVNKSLFELSDLEIDDILNHLDFDKYLQLFHDCFEKNWMNKAYDGTEIIMSNTVPATITKDLMHVSIIRENEDPTEFELSNIMLLNDVL